MKRLVALFSLLACVPASARDIGEVSTAFKLLGPNHKIVITAFEDPKIAAAVIAHAMLRNPRFRQDLARSASEIAAVSGTVKR